MGAWIETKKCLIAYLATLSHPAWVRGLKRIVVQSAVRVPLVAPCVGAWIETSVLAAVYAMSMSHPAWVRGLKPFALTLSVLQLLSHPAWVRGLKPAAAVIPAAINRRTLRGCVD